MADVIKTAEFYAKLLVTETIDVGIDGVTNQDHTLEISGLSGSLTPSTTPAVTKVWKDQGALVAGAATIDLTALARDNLPNIDLTDLKVQIFAIKNNSTTYGLTVDIGAANPYDLFGDANGQVTIGKDSGFVLFYSPEGLENVDATHCEIDLSSTDTTCSYDVIIVAG